MPLSRGNECAARRGCGHSARGLEDGCALVYLVEHGNVELLCSAVEAAVELLQEEGSTVAAVVAEVGIMAVCRLGCHPLGGVNVLLIL